MQQNWIRGASYSTVGLEFSLSVIAGLFFGQWLDEKFQTGSLLTLVWFCFGLIAGGRAIYRALQRANRDAAREDADAKAAHQKYLDDQNPR